MKEYVFDANAILRYLRVVEAEGGDEVQELFEQSQRGASRLMISVVNFGEIYHILL